MLSLCNAVFVSTTLQDCFVILSFPNYLLVMPKLVATQSSTDLATHFSSTRYEWTPNIEVRNKSQPRHEPNSSMLPTQQQ